MSAEAEVSVVRRHWPEYWREAAGLGVFMLAASSFAALLEHPASPVRQALADAFVRRALMGAAMGLTAIALIYSAWGKRSGAHYNPAVTLTFFRLGKVAVSDLYGYIAAQFIGGIAGISIARLLLGSYLAHPSVHYVATIPGGTGVAIAFLSEFLMTALLMTVVLQVSNRPSIAHYTGVAAGACVALFITFEAPLSGMSLNPARTFASAFAAGDWTALWIYFTAPPAGMLFAAGLYSRLAEMKRAKSPACAKLYHSSSHRCIFCEYQTERANSVRVRSR